MVLAAYLVTSGMLVKKKKKKKKIKRGKDHLNVLVLVIKKTNGDGEKKTHNPPREQLYS